MEKEEIVQIIKELLAKELSRMPESFSSEDQFRDLGIDSISALFMIDELGSRCGKELDILAFFNYPTITAFADYVYKTVN